MSAIDPFVPTLEFTDEHRIAANQEILEQVTRSLFMSFMSDEPMSENDIDELLGECFEISAVLMAVCGMRVIGENLNGDYVVNFHPHASIEDFTKENEWRVKNV